MLDGQEHKTGSDSTNYIEGRRAVAEALRAGRPIDKLYIAKGTGGLSRLIADAKGKGVVVVERDRRNLDAISVTQQHQGVIATVAARSYADIEDLFKNAESSGKPPFFAVCDGIEDSRNLGAICRTAEAAGVHGLIIAKRRSAGLTPWADKTAAGALEYLPVARVSNLASTLRFLKEKGLWIYGADGSGELSVMDAELSGPAAFVFGGEHGGMSRIVRDQCDFTLSIPMYGRINSLNVSAAAAVILYAAAKAREERR